MTNRRTGLPEKFTGWIKLLLAPVLYGMIYPLLTVLHEMGHFVIGHFQGCKPILTYNAIVYTHHSKPGSSDLLRVAAGPLVDFTLATIGIIGLWRLRRRGTSSHSSLIWLWTTLAAAALKWTFIPGVGIPSLADFRGIATSLGYHPVTVSCLMSPFALLGWCVLVICHRRSGTLILLAVNAVAGMASMIVYMLIIGPLILPRP